MDRHMERDEHDFSNRRNSHMSAGTDIYRKKTINTLRNRNSIFDLLVIRKHEKLLAGPHADHIVGLYAIGNSTREISDIFEEQYGNRISAETICSITN